MTQSRNYPVVFLLLLLLSVNTTGIYGELPTSTPIIGNYSVSFIANATPKDNIQVIIQASQIIVKGCNTNIASFSYDSNTKTYVVGAFRSTRIACRIDQDSLITQALANSKVANLRNKQVVFENSQKVITLKLSTTPLYQPSFKGIELSKIVGSYFVFSVPSTQIVQQISVEITSSQIRIVGCNNQNGAFNYDTKTQTFQISAFASTLKFCPDGDQDRFVSQAFANSVLAIQRDGFLIFQNADGQDTITLSTQNFHRRTEQSQIYGQFFASSVSRGTLKKNIKVEISLDSIIVSGCNINRSSFKYNKGTRTFSVDPAFTSTLRFCPDDQDSLIITAILGAKYVYKRNGEIVFEDSGSVQLLRLSTSQAIFETPSLTLNQVLGTYYLLSAKGTTITVTISQSSIAIFGCNKLQADVKFDIFSRTFTFSNLVTITRKFCGSEDTPISQAFLAAVTASWVNNELVFFDSTGSELISLSTVDPTPQPQPQPVPSYQSVYLKGTYYLKPVEGETAALLVIVDHDYIQFQGCNIHRYPYAAYSDGLFVLLQGGSSTQRACLFDNDAKYIDLLTNSNRFSKNGLDNFDLYNGNNLLIRFERRVRNQVVRSNVINGAYQLQITNGLDAYVSQTQISLGNCKVSIPYQLGRNNEIAFGSFKQCSIKIDNAYIDAILRAVAIRSVQDGFSFIDSTGVETIRFISFVSISKFQCRCFGGTYQLKVPSAGIRLSISDGAFSLQGCNIYKFGFYLSDGGDIVFRNIENPTTSSCKSNYDNIYLEVIRAAQNIAVLGSNIAFFNGEGTQIIKAINFEQSKTDTGVFDQSNPVVGIQKLKIPDGNYKFAILRSSLKIINTLIVGNQISYKICNNWRFSIDGHTNGTVKITLRSATKIACPFDQDKQYSTALQSIVKFSQMKGMYTFYDKSGRSVVSFTSDFGGFTNNKLPVEQKPAEKPIAVVLPAILPIISKPIEIIKKILFQTIAEAVISFSGNYKFQLPKLTFEVTPSQDFVFKGCNNYRVPIILNNFNFQLGQLGNRNDNCKQKTEEDYFFNLIKQSSSFRKETTSSKSILFVNSKSETIFRAETIVSKNVQVNGIQSGSYATQFPSIDVNFSDSSFVFNSCKQNKFNYKAFNSGKLQVSGNGCSSDLDAYKNAIIGSTRYRSVDNGYIFEDENGKERARCTRK